MTTTLARINFKDLSHSLLLSAIISLVSIATGIVPDITAGQPSQIFNSAARADDFSDKDLRSYAAALMQIEPIRQATLPQVSRANGGGRLPNLVCSQRETMNGLTEAARTLFINYCNRCESITSSLGLSIDKFNQITQSLHSNPQLKSRVRDFMN